jgi:hypothetical protein
MKGFLVAVMVVALPTAAFAQDYDPVEQQRLSDWRSGTQKAGLVTMGIAIGLGMPLAANMPTLFSDGLCKAGDPMFGKMLGESFACNGGLAITHFIFAASTLVLFVTSEILAAEMVNSPYRTGDTSRDNAARAFMWTNVGLFSVQPLLGLLAAHPGLIGIPPDARLMFSKVLRTIHFSVGLGLASTYAIQAGLMW